MVKRKQLTDFNLSAPVQISGLSVSGSSANISSAIATALSTAGENSNGNAVAVPVQTLGGSNKIGVIVTAPHNRCEVWDNTTGDKFVSDDDREVYGRLTATGSTYTLSFYSLEAGTETAYSFANATSIRIEFNYRFDAARLPADALIATQSRNISSDPNSGGGSVNFQSELLSVTGLNTLADLSMAPIDSNDVTLIVNNSPYTVAAGNFSITGQTITWSVSSTKFNLEVDDTVVAEYFVGA